MARRTDGQIRHRGLRHQWWEVPGIREQVCAKCGEPKPRADEDQTPCRGQSLILQNPEALRRIKERTIANLMLAWSWARMAREGGHRMDPNVIQANRAATFAPLSRVGAASFKEMVDPLTKQAKKAYEACSTHAPESRVHCMAVCVLIVRLAAVGIFPEEDQAHLTSLAILQEVQDNADWPAYREGELGQLADRMMKALQDMGYFTRPAKNALHW